MQKLSLVEMEEVQGGDRRDDVMKVACAAAAGAMLFGPIGWLVAGPTAVGCIVYGATR